MTQDPLPFPKFACTLTEGSPEHRPSPAPFSAPCHVSISHSCLPGHRTGVMQDSGAVRAWPPLPSASVVAGSGASGTWPWPDGRDRAAGTAAVHVCACMYTCPCLDVGVGGKPWGGAGSSVQFRGGGGVRRAQQPAERPRATPGPGPGRGWPALAALLPRETQLLCLASAQSALGGWLSVHCGVVRAPRGSVRAQRLSVRAGRVSVRARRVQAGLAHPLCPRLPQGRSGTRRPPASSS